MSGLVAQHGLSKVNQFPWEFSDRVDHLVGELTKFQSDKIEGELKKAEPSLKQGVFPEGTLIATEPARQLRNTDSFTLEEQISRGKGVCKQFAKELIIQLEARITEKRLLKLMKAVFHNWEDGKLKELLEIANCSGRNYGTLEVLTEQFLILKCRYRDTRGKDEISRWVALFTKKNLYMDISDILHFSLCCFVKSPLEAVAESIGSVINRHGSDDRASLLPASLSDEVQLSWNGPEEFDDMVDALVEETIEQYFSNAKTGVRFYVKSAIRLMSPTIASYCQQRSRIEEL